MDFLHHRDKSITINVNKLLDDLGRKKEAVADSELEVLLEEVRNSVSTLTSNEITIPHYSDVLDDDNFVLCHSYPEWSNGELGMQDDPTAYRTLAWLLFKNGYDNEIVVPVDMRLFPYETDMVTDLLSDLDEGIAICD